MYSAHVVVAALRTALVVGSSGLLVACSPGPRPEVPDAAPDAAPDAPPIPAGGEPCEWLSSLEYTPVTLTGTSPTGSLDGFHYAFAAFTSCGPAYEIDFTPTATGPQGLEPSLRLWIMWPFTATGTNRAMALHAYPEAMTDMVTFEATQLDGLEAAPPHIIGHFVSHDPGWTFDISVDLTSQCISSCI